MVCTKEESPESAGAERRGTAERVAATQRNRTERRQRGGEEKISSVLATLVVRQPPRRWMSLFIKGPFRRPGVSRRPRPSGRLNRRSPLRRVDTPSGASQTRGFYPPNHPDSSPPFGSSSSCLTYRN
ncbi:hypothetical protein K0M31_010226 [Melipona bicolor]|uniref:Uncharacterized protein n=1 Tax=Melipona bicolor TaxID=60889 RepID=A0AA40FMK1_9HYME|nr:hypothetical protein K0M31_010226 [Melipona bicolor]